MEVTYTTEQLSECRRKLLGIVGKEWGIGAFLPIPHSAGAPQQVADWQRGAVGIAWTWWLVSALAEARLNAEDEFAGENRHAGEILRRRAYITYVVTQRLCSGFIRQLAPQLEARCVVEANELLEQYTQWVPQHVHQ